MKTYFKNLYKALIGKWSSGQLEHLDMPVDKCECLTTDIGNYCNAEYKNYLFCTMSIGHKGKHVACTTDRHKIKIWE